MPRTPHAPSTLPPAAATITLPFGELRTYRHYDTVYVDFEALPMVFPAASRADLDAGAASGVHTDDGVRWVPASALRAVGSRIDAAAWARQVLDVIDRTYHR